MKRIVLLASVLSFAIAPMLADNVYEDDIYYNPKKDKALKYKKLKKNNYIANMADMDVDEYNGRGHYTPMPSDTIGGKTENGEDFVYTQQIQKYYNPTVVIDNADQLGDILSRSYGNVNIVVDCDNIMFEPWYRGYPSYAFYSPFTRWGFGNYYWGAGPGLTWGISWCDPWFVNPIYNPWAWNWAWNWGPAWYPARPGWDYPRYTPYGNRRSGIGGNWARGNAGGNYRGSYNKGSMTAAGRPGTTGNRRMFNSISSPNAVVNNGTATRPGNNRGYYINQQGHRVTNPATTTRPSNTTNSSRNYYNSNRSGSHGNHRESNVPKHYYNYDPGSYSSSQGSYGSGSYGGSYGGGHRSSGGGGGGRGRHR